MGYNAKNHEIFDVRGDGRKRAPAVSEGGIHAGYDLQREPIGRPVFDDPKRSRLVECEVYEIGDHLLVIIACPQCESDLNVPSDKKRIRFQKDENGRGQLSIERFKCTTPGCGWRSEIRNNVAKDW